MPPARPADAPDPEGPDPADSFDPGAETGYPRRVARDHELPLEIGAKPFDPGPERYDDRRARRAARRLEKTESRERARQQQAELKLREREAAAERERIARERAVEAERERAEQEREAKARAERERAAAAERERADRERREEEEQRERAQRLVRQREERLAAERERVARAHAERERLRREERERIKRERAQRRRAELARVTAEAAERKRPRVVPAGTKERTPRQPRPKPQPASLRVPTAKVGLALAAVTALAAGAGTLLGLPVPGLDTGSGRNAASLAGDASLLSLSDGTPTGLSKGPYFPIVGSVGYGESAARFGAPRGGRRHEGQDLFAKPGTPLVAVRNGTVVDGGGINDAYSGGRGNWIAIYSPLDERSYVYLHMLKPPLVRKGDSVQAGQPIGQLGCTGSCYGPHLHFEVRNGVAGFRSETKAIDPLPLLKAWPQLPAQ